MTLLQLFIQIDRKLYLITLTPSTEADFHEGRAKKYTENNFKKYLQNYIKYIVLYELTKLTISIIKKLINNSRGKYKRNECLINVCKSDTDLS